MKTIKVLIATAIIACAVFVGTHSATQHSEAGTQITTITDPGGSGGGGN